VLLHLHVIFFFSLLLTKHIFLINFLINKDDNGGTQINGLNNKQRQQNRQTQGPATMLQGSYQQSLIVNQQQQQHPPSSSSLSMPINNNNNKQQQQIVSQLQQQIEIPQTSRNTIKDVSKEVFNSNNINGDFFNEDIAKMNKNKADG
jgi:hypothetical protein